MNAFIPKDVRVINEKNDTVNFAALINKPTILNLVYYRCPGICSPVMNSLAEVIQKMGKGMIIGTDYQVLTISFDHRETTDVAVKKKKNYMNLMKNPIDPEGWRFFTSDIQQFLHPAWRHHGFCDCDPRLAGDFRELLSAALFMAFFGLILNQWVGIALLVGAVIVILSFINLLRPVKKSPDYGFGFMKLNFFYLYVMILLWIDALV